MPENRFYFAFVILHYNVLHETLRCVQSIRDNIHDVDYKIIVVDNASPNHSGTDLVKQYKDDSSVVVLVSENNLGFAKGNNIGVYYARKTLKADFVVALNNDTYLIQKDFPQVIEEEWMYSSFAVMGPRVFTPSGVNQNPVPFEVNCIAEVNKRIWKYSLAYFRALLGIDSLCYRIKDYAKKVLRKKNEKIVLNERNQLCRQENVKLHGCCLIFSPKYFEYFDGFDPQTFMYLEEDILIAHLRRKKLLSVYNPKLQIFHAEMAATKSLSKTNRKKQLFVYGQYLKSLKILKMFFESAEG